MNRRIAAALLLTLIAVPMYADFAAVARAIDGHHGVKRIYIPFLGLARFAVKIVAPEGVHDFQLATFEGTDGVDPRKLKDVMRSKVGPGFMPLVQVYSRRSNDWSFIYARPSKDGSRIELMIPAHDSSDTVLVRVEVDSDMIARELKDHPRKVSHHARR